MNRNRIGVKILNAIECSLPNAHIYIGRLKLYGARPVCARRGIAIVRAGSRESRIRAVCLLATHIHWVARIYADKRAVSFFDLDISVLVAHKIIHENTRKGGQCDARRRGGIRFRRGR